MAAAKSRWKLGLFVLIAVGATIVAVIALGECSTHHETASFHTYFDESVGGLQSGGRVAFRGVDVGSISDIAIAPDHRHVDVEYDLDVGALASMGITAAARDGGAQYDVPPNLRAQVGGNGITGVRYVALDVADARAPPPPALPFAASPNTIPSTPSSMKTLEDTLTKGVATLDDVLGRFDRARVPEKAAKTLDGVRAALAKMNHAVDAFGQVGRGASSSVRDLDQALDELRDAAEAIRVLAEDLDRDPDMLLKGRARRKSP